MALSLRVKLLLVFGAVLVLTMAIGVIGMYEVGRINERIATFRARSLTGLVARYQL